MIEVRTTIRFAVSDVKLRTKSVRPKYRAWAMVSRIVSWARFQGRRSGMLLKRNGRGRVWRTGCLAGAVALLFQIVSWAWMPAWISSARAETNRIVICTADGFKTVALDDHGVPADPDGAPSDAGVTDGSCPLCPLVGGLAMPPLGPLPVTVGFLRHGPEFLPGSRIAAGWFLSSLQARAPPANG
ncbi:DUF2946 domain-containing protein [Azospirillum sp. B510]|uniref:DUF2946 domain-containing protein n=1 Tax=Azospirillum sp. (strain B510) TaxID=137722 RepID=UPI001FFF222D|nr:DUF2946 domain-containing protein [Azospirillum sp. B510]